MTGLALMIAALSIGVQSADDVAGPRAAFDACLERQLGVAKADGISAAEFRAALNTACAEEARRFRAALVKYDMATGQSRAEAEAWADQDVQDHRDAAARRFGR